MLKFINQLTTSQFYVMLGLGSLIALTALYLQERRIGEMEDHLETLDKYNNLLDSVDGSKDQLYIEIDTFRVLNTPAVESTTTEL